MIEIVVILTVAYILVPLFDLSLAERVRYAAKLVVYIVALLWIIYMLWFSGVRML